MRYSFNKYAFSFRSCCGTSLVVIFAAALLASSFGLMRYSFNKYAFSFCSCCGIFLSIRSVALFLVSCASISFLAAAFFYCDDNILIPFFELGVFNNDVFVFFVCSILTIGLRFFSSPDMSVLFWRVDQEGSHKTSMVASHVDHVVIQVVSSATVQQFSSLARRSNRSVAEGIKLRSQRIRVRGVVATLRPSNTHECAWYLRVPVMAVGNHHEWVLQTQQIRTIKQRMVWTIPA